MSSDCRLYVPGPESPCLRLPSRSRRWSGLLLVAFLWAGAGCGEQEPPPEVTWSAIPDPTPQDTVTPDATALWRSEGTIRMAQELHSIYRKAWEDPRPFFLMNRRRAQIVRGMLDGARPEERMGYRTRIARELLDGGQTEAAIQEVERLLEDLDADPGGMTRETRALYELLAFAYQRLGEQQNCLASHSAEVCIMPFRGGGLHQLRKGSERATEIFADVLRQYPGDFQSRWLFNVAHMTLGDYPDRVATEWLIDSLDDREGFPEFENIAVDLGIDVSGLSGGVSVDDFNNDGFLDVFATGYGLNEQAHLLMNDGEGGFVDRTKEAGLIGQVSGLNVIHADYNNDGFVDLFILRGAWLGDNGMHPNSLLRNNGDGTFSDVTEEAGVLSYHPTNSGVWTDLNLDGWIDLYIGNESRFRWEADDPFYGGGGDVINPCELYLNNGDGTFTEVASRVGLDVVAFVKGVAAGDINNDGWPDLYLSVMGNRNRLYLNRGGTSLDDWRFDEIADRARVTEPNMSFPVWFWDYDNDGWEDLAVFAYGLYQSSDATSDVAREYLGRPTLTAKSRLYRNNRDGSFQDVTRAVGLSRRVLFSMGANFGDINNDGFPEFYLGTGAPQLLSLIPNRLFLSEKGARFRDITLETGVGHLQKGHAIGFGDFNRDGSQDIYAVMGGAVEGDVASNVLFQNPVPEPDNAWVILSLEGRTANRSAIGARIAATVRDGSGKRWTVHTTVSTGGSFGSSSLQAELGLGPAERIDTLRVTWPNRARTTQTFTDLPVRSDFRLVEGGDPEALDRPPVVWKRQPMSGMHH